MSFCKTEIERGANILKHKYDENIEEFEKGFKTADHEAWEYFVKISNAKPPILMGVMLGLNSGREAPKGRWAAFWENWPGYVSPMGLALWLCGFQG